MVGSAGNKANSAPLELGLRMSLAILQARCVNVMYSNAVKVIYVVRGCMVLLINDCDCTM